MIKTVKTQLDLSLISGLDEKLGLILPLNRFGHIPIWSSDCINAEEVYRIHRLSQRIVEEAGWAVQKNIAAEFSLSDSIFPYKMQLIKIDSKIFNSGIHVKDQICQTITPLTENCKTYIIENSDEDIEISELEMGTYAVASYWTHFMEPSYTKWFINKYLRTFSEEGTKSE